MCAAHLNFAQRAAFLILLDDDVFRPEAHHLRDHELDIVCLGRVDCRGNLAVVQRKRLFAKHVFPGRRGLLNIGAVQVGRQADVDDVDVRLRKQLLRRRKILAAAFVRERFALLAVDVRNADEGMLR
ncbi:hypothetical protein SDC9_173162 [bioreactor metagenome]|uniref:Uncharacterized protein n=1 Tax=bioreactor metagenome TaxID=1076179 RepID=A0A645GFQ8_9ZZZZ